MNLMEALIQSKLGGGGGSVTPASIVTATGQMTAQQAADTLDNIGGEPEKLVVYVTESGGVYSADKTQAEIYNAYSAGKTVVVYNTLDDLNYQLVFCDPTLTVFATPDVESAPIGAKMLSVENDGASDTWTYTNSTYSFTPSKVTDLSSTSITLSSAANNTIYEYGELSALTVTAITNPGDFIIRFTSGATPTTTNFPASMKFPEAFSAEANTRYEINCSNGYALAVGWPTT